MCGRYTLTTSIAKFLNQLEIEFPDELAHPRRYNVAPSQPVFVLVADPYLRFEIVEWGYVPTWSKPGSPMRPVINARVESLREGKPYFRGAFHSARCAVLADGFFEWKKERDGKHPYRIGLRSGELFAMAGLWSAPHAADGAEHLTCAIITVEANSFMAPIHDRMPAILRAEDLPMWLDPRTSERNLYTALEPFPADQMSAYEVSTLVNNPRNDVPECIAPLGGANELGL